MTNDHHREGGAPPADGASRALLALALVVGLTRFARLGEWGLWIDEAFTLADSLHPLDPFNPLGYRLWALWLEVVGPAPSELELRLPAAVLGYACVPLLAFAARPLVGARAAALSALLLAASSWHLYWSQSARFYTLAMALVLLGTGLSLRGAARRRAAPLVGGWLVVATGALAHPSAALALPGLVLAPLFRGRPGAADGRLRTVCVAALVAAGALGGLWALDVLGTWNRIKGRPNTAHLVLSSGFYLTPVLAAAALFGALDVWRRRDHPAFPALLVSVLGWVLALAASTQMRTSAQYVFVLQPFALVLAAAPLWGRSAPVKGPGAVGYGGLLVAPLVTSSFLYLTVRSGERPRWREAFSVVAEGRRDGDLVLGMAAPVGQYYLAPGSTDLRALGALEYLNHFTYEAVPHAVATGRRTWFVVNPERFEDWPRDGRVDELRRVLREDCRLVADFPLQVESRDLSVQVFLRE